MKSIYFNNRIYVGCEKPMPEKEHEKYYMGGTPFGSDMYNYTAFDIDMREFTQYLASFPNSQKFEVTGTHDWKDGQEVVEGKDYKVQHQFFYNGTNKGTEVKTAWHNCNEADRFYPPSQRRIVALPIEQEQPTAPKQESKEEMTIKEECQMCYETIEIMNKLLKELRERCKHEQTFEGNYSWRIGSIEPATICSDCGEVIKIHRPDPFIKNI